MQRQQKVNSSRFYLAKLSVEKLKTWSTDVTSEFLYSTTKCIRAQGKDSIIQRLGFNSLCVFCRGLPLKEDAQVLPFYVSVLVFSTKHYNVRIQGVQRFVGEPN
jgi:hypothetical protein